MKKTCWAGVVALAGMALVGQAHAATMPITFSGGGVSGSLTITFGPATDAIYSNAFEITGVSGTFSDTQYWYRQCLGNLAGADKPCHALGSREYWSSAE